MWHTKCHSYCGLLQSVAVCCSLLQSVAVCCSLLQSVAEHHMWHTMCHMCLISRMCISWRTIYVICVAYVMCISHMSVCMCVYVYLSHVRVCMSVCVCVCVCGCVARSNTPYLAGFFFFCVRMMYLRFFSCACMQNINTWGRGNLKWSISGKCKTNLWYLWGKVYQNWSRWREEG